MCFLFGKSRGKSSDSDSDSDSDSGEVVAGKIKSCDKVSSKHSLETFVHAQLQKFLRHDNQKTTEIYAGILDAGTQEQGDFLGDFWSKKLAGVDGFDGAGE